MPPSYFRPVGQAFVDHYNRRFDGQMGPEWAGYSLAYLVYCAVGSMNNFSHPGFARTAPDELQASIFIEFKLLTVYFTRLSVPTGY